MPEPGAPSLWRPLRVIGFRALCSAQLLVNIAVWCHTVAAQWVLIDRDSSTALVASVQTAITIPFFLVAVPAGVLSDSLDRRRVLVLMQFGTGAVSAALAFATIGGLAGPVVLLLATALMGTGNAVAIVAWQSLIPELVDRELVPSAATLDGMSFNTGRIAGPAVGGLLLAVIAPSWVFIGDAVVFAVAGLAFWRWAPSRQLGPRRERFGPAIRAGWRFVTNSPPTRRLMARAFWWTFPGSVMWALLPVLAHERLGLSSAGYGGLAASLGIGAVVGAVVLSPIRARLNVNQILALCSFVYAAATAITALVPVVAVVAIVLPLAGAAWVTVLALVMSTAQVSLPVWVRARGIAFVLLVHQGCQAFGALLWGFVGELFGVVPAFLISAVLLGAAAISVRWAGLLPVGLSDTVTVELPPPAGPGPGAGAVRVRVEYCVAPARIEQFRALAGGLGPLRRSIGVSNWVLEPADLGSGRVVETFLVPSWEEYVLQESVRWTSAGKQVRDQVEALADGPPSVRWTLATAPTRAADSAASPS